MMIGSMAIMTILNTISSIIQIIYRCKQCRWYRARIKPKDKTADHSDISMERSFKKTTDVSLGDVEINFELDINTFYHKVSRTNN